MSRYIRTAVALIVFAGFFCLFFGVATGVNFAFLAKLQLVPALLALNFLALAILVLLTLVFGRLYCSVLCPLGIFQDLMSRLGGLFTSKKKRKSGRFGFSKANNALRYSILAIFIILLIVGSFGAVAMLWPAVIDPYSIFGRALTAMRYPLASTALTIIASVSLAAVAVIAFVGGRAYCNQICPVGTALGLLSRFSLFAPVIDNDKCNSCGSCSRRCKASCIDSKNHHIDRSRCVTCFDCLGACKRGALSYGLRRKKPAFSHARRSMLTSLIALTAVGSVTAAPQKPSKLIPLKKKKTPQRATAVVPPGAKGPKALERACIGCQLCFTACPNDIIRPKNGPEGLLTPELDFSAGWCRPECTKCGHTCPAGVIQPLSRPEKASLKIGTAVVNPKTCISAAYGQKCGKCARVCPHQAIVMQDIDGRLTPVVDASKCIGCGYCEYICPVGTAPAIRQEYAAIHVEGLQNQQTL